jgi:TatD DNase family protein
VIDFHCHIDLYPDPAAVAAEASRLGVYVLAVTTTPAAWAGAHERFGQVPRLRLAVGLHPELAHTPHGDVGLLASLLSRTRYVGEIGLDGTPALRPHTDVQRDVFERVLQACANAGGKILSIHSRRAASEVLDCLERRPDSGTPVLHWFSGSRAQLQRAVQLGCWFSVGPAMAVSASGREAIQSMPRDRVLTESDGPFVEVGSRPATPADMAHVEALLAAAWPDMSPDDVHGQMLGNLRRLVTMSSIPGRRP